MPDGSDIDALRTALAAAEVKAVDAEARAANAVAMVSDAEAQIAALKLMIEKLRRALYGQRSERKQRLLDQLELQLDELEASATEDELAAEQAAAGTTQVKGFTRRRRSGRKPFPAHLPRERVVVPPPSACGCCGSEKLSKIGEDITETQLQQHRLKVFDGTGGYTGVSGCTHYIFAIQETVRRCVRASSAARRRQRPGRPSRPGPEHVFG